MPDNGYHDKIRKVLAMLEGAKTPGEAQAASLALQRLMARSGLTAEQVDALGAENVQFPVTQDGVYIGTNDVAWKKMLAAVIGENFRCEAIACSADCFFHCICFLLSGLMQRNKLTLHESSFFAQNPQRAFASVSIGACRRSVSEANVSDGPAVGSISCA